MSAKHALLGLLLERPAYQYELADRLQARLGPAWEVNSGQVSKAIRDLEANGMIEPVEDPAPRSKDRKVFAVTEPGAREFSRWCEEGPGELPRLSRRSVLVKIGLGGPERLRKALDHIDEYERDCAVLLNELSRSREDVQVDAANLRADHVLLRLGLNADVFQIEAELKWARNAREEVSWLLDRAPIWPAGAARTTSVTEEERARLAAREELFGRMASKHLRSIETERQGRRDEGDDESGAR